MIIYKQDHLRNLAERYINNPDFTFEDIKNNDITQEYFTQVRKYIEQGTLFVVNFNGHTTDGKSTCCAENTRFVNEDCYNKPMKASYIQANQQEYALWVQKYFDTRHLMVQIDEWSALAESGANATIEEKYLQELSNIHAQTYIHRGYCSPNQLPDPNILIHFEVASRNDEEQYTVCYAYYNLKRGGNTVPQIIGHVVFDVSKVLSSQWYAEYRKKKFQKIELLRKHNIVHERELYYASVIKETIKGLIGHTLMGKLVSERTIRAKAQVYCLRQGIRQTMIGIEYTVVDYAKPVLDLYTMSTKYNDEISRKRKMLIKSDASMTDSIQYEINLLKDQLKNVLEDIDFYMNEFARKERLFEEYKQI